MIFSSIFLVIGLAGVALAFWFNLWAWVPVGIGSAVLVLYLKVIRATKRSKIPELSDDANDMFNKYKHFYMYPYGARDFSASCGLMQVSFVVIAIVNAFHHFWWGILLGVIAYPIMAFTAKGYNPTNALFAGEVDAHEEVMAHIQEKKDEKLKKMMQAKS